jgi:hypothetical protein
LQNLFSRWVKRKFDKAHLEGLPLCEVLIEARNLTEEQLKRVRGTYGVNMGPDDTLTLNVYVVSAIDEGVLSFLPHAKVINLNEVALGSIVKVKDYADKIVQAYCEKVIKEGF